MNPVKQKKVPRCMANSMAAVVLRDMRAFYGDPENMAKFVEWKKGKEESNGPAYAPIPV